MEFPSSTFSIFGLQEGMRLWALHLPAYCHEFDVNTTNRVLLHDHSHWSCHQTAPFWQEGNALLVKARLWVWLEWKGWPRVGQRKFCTKRKHVDISHVDISHDMREPRKRHEQEFVWFHVKSSCIHNASRLHRQLFAGGLQSLRRIVGFDIISVSQTHIQLRTGLQVSSQPSHWWFDRLQGKHGPVPGNFLGGCSRTSDKAWSVDNRALRLLEMQSRWEICLLRKKFGIWQSQKQQRNKQQKPKRSDPKPSTKLPSLRMQGETSETTLSVPLR